VDTVHECDRRTDGQTDRQTDRITITKTVQRIASHGKNGPTRQLLIKLIILVHFGTHQHCLWNQLPLPFRQLHFPDQSLPRSIASTLTSSFSRRHLIIFILTIHYSFLVSTALTACFFVSCTNQWLFKTFLNLIFQFFCYMQ